MGQYGETVYLNISSFTGLPSRAGGALHACLPCGEGKGKGREELIDTPHSLSLPISADCLSVCLRCGTCSVSVCLAIWWFVVILKVNRYPSADDWGGPIWNPAYTTFF